MRQPPPLQLGRGCLHYLGRDMEAWEIKVRMQSSIDGPYLHAGDMVKLLQTSAEELGPDKRADLSLKAVASIVEELSSNPIPLLPITY